MPELIKFDDEGMPHPLGADDIFLGDLRKGIPIDVARLATGSNLEGPLVEMAAAVGVRQIMYTLLDLGTGNTKGTTSALSALLNWHKRNTTDASDEIDWELLKEKMM